MFIQVVILMNIIRGLLTTGTTVEISTRVGLAVHFYMPSFEECGQYALTGPAKNVIVSVLKTSHTIEPLYVNRSTCMSLQNGTMLFTLHHIIHSDFGSYLTNPGGQANSNCWIKYNLKQEHDEKPANSDTSYWLSWEAWSSCQATCGYGKRTRIRMCSIPNMCSMGHVEENIDCNSGVLCDSYDWSLWSQWSKCNVTCGGGARTRYRTCMRNNIQRADVSNCVGDVMDRGSCGTPSCDEAGTTPVLRATHRVSYVYQWTSWDMWSTCSQSCDTGFHSRSRKCQYVQQIIDVRYCSGNSIENGTCENTSCNYDSAINEVELPLSVIVGAGAVLCILILFVVICVLVLKLRRRKAPRTIPVLVDLHTQHDATRSVEPNTRPKFSIVSLTSTEGGHVYDTINDDDVKSRDRQSILTIDNPYVSMPKSPDGNPYKNETVMYNNTQENVFTFDRNTGSGRKVSNAYQNTGSTLQGTSNQLDIPRHMSVDSVGYLMPGSAAERALKRNKKYKH